MKKKRGVTAYRADIRKYTLLIRNYKEMGVSEDRLKVIHDLRAEAQELVNHLTLCKLEEMESRKSKEAVRGKAIRIKSPDIHKRP